MLSNIIQLARCVVRKHKPVREQVQWDRGSYVGKCRGCRTQIRRDFDRSWRKDWM